MPTKRNFEGVIAPVLTPFTSDGSVDEERFIEHCEWLLQDGCTALAPFGTTSEGASIGIDERMELLEAIVDSDIDAEKLMPGTGMCSVSDAIVLTEHAVDLGVGGVLMLPPFYYKNPSEEGLFRYFAEVIEEVGASDLKVYLYHIPPIAQVGFTLALIERLVKAYPKTIIGLKDSSGDWANTKAVLDAFPQLEVFPGSEGFLLDALRAGGSGCISATANVAARTIRKVFDNWQSPEADVLQAEVTKVRKAFQAFPLIPVLKAVISHYRNDPEWAILRPPFVTMTNEERAAAVRTLADTCGFRLEFADAAE